MEGLDCCCIVGTKYTIQLVCFSHLTNTVATTAIIAFLALDYIVIVTKPAITNK